MTNSAQPKYLYSLFHVQMTQQATTQALPKKKKKKDISDTCCIMPKKVSRLVTMYHLEMIHIPHMRTQISHTWR